jgi:SpoVK/Ycf46/Vps4 family AAA+-type ATPase
VGKEWNTFLQNCHFKDKENRRMYVLVEKSCPQELVPLLLRDIQRPESIDHIITELIKFTMENLKRDLSGTTKEKEEDVSSLQTQLEQEKRKVQEARDYYLRADCACLIP